MADAADGDPLYLLLAELERLEEARERLREGDPVAAAELRELGLASADALDARIAALHRQLDEADGGSEA